MHELFIILIQIVIFLFLFPRTQTKLDSSSQPNLRSSTIYVPGRKPKLADGCHAVYLDLGSNVGVQVRKLFEPELYPKAPVLPYYDRLFGPVVERRKPGRVCAFGFEANPSHEARLKAVEDCYGKRGWRTQFLTPVAVLNDDNQTIKFFRDNATKHNNWGSSIFNNEGMSDHVQVPTVHLGRFIMEEIVGRLLPEGEVEPGPVFAKFDIEGAEYQTFGGLIATGALCHITEATVELHPSNVPHPDYLKTASMIEELAKMPRELLGCRSMRIGYMDDESYHKDNSPLTGCNMR